MSSRLLARRQEKMKEEVKKFMADGKHYSHDHQLSLREDKEDDDLCGICGVPILSSPSYNCTTLNCRFLLHQQCAVKLTSTLIHSTHGPGVIDRHVLYMSRSPPPSSSSSSSPNYTYKCEDCEFETHPLSAVVGGVEIKIKHRSHPAHPLGAFCRESVSLCDACGREEKGFFFSCQLCNFWIHQDCTILPSVVALPSYPQPYILTYSPPNPPMSSRCQVCYKRMPPRVNGVYFSPHSISFAHIACATKKPAQQETRLELVQLPDDEWDTFPSRAIRIYHNQQENAKKKGDKNMTIEKYHKQHHPLILTTTTITITTPPPPPQDDDDDDDDDVSSTGAKKLLLSVSACDLCTQPIHSSSPFHRCGKLECPFVAHESCADILPNIHKFVIPIGVDLLRMELYPDPGKHFFNSVFYCSFCRRPCNGLCSHTRFFGDTRCIDLECLAAPITVTHASHPNPHHLLFRTRHDPYAAPPLTCCSSGGTFLYDVYRCIVCNYSLHISCAMLPKRIRFPQYHRPHPLFLIYNATTTSTAAAAVDEDFCEVCEEGIDLKYWMYRCVECHESYHINCIPSLGYLSKVKFGGKLSLSSSVHAHPLTLTRMLTLPSQRCGASDCKRIIHGMVDEMSFFCSLCHFWLHFSCARNSAARHTSDPLRLYSDVSHQLRYPGFHLKMLAIEQGIWRHSPNF